MNYNSDDILKKVEKHIAKISKYGELWSVFSWKREGERHIIGRGFTINLALEEFYRKLYKIPAHAKLTFEN